MNPYEAPPPISDALHLHECDRDQCPYCLTRHGVRKVLGEFSYRCDRCDAPLTVGLSKQNNRIVTAGFLLMIPVAISMKYIYIPPVFATFVFIPMMIWMAIVFWMQYNLGFIKPKPVPWHNRLAGWARKRFMHQRDG